MVNREKVDPERLRSCVLREGGRIRRPFKKLCSRNFKRPIARNEIEKSLARFSLETEVQGYLASKELQPPK